jgi:hypothetical protein
MEQYIQEHESPMEQYIQEPESPMRDEGPLCHFLTKRNPAEGNVLIEARERAMRDSLVIVSQGQP